MPMQASHCVASCGTVPKALFSSGTCTTATCRSADSATAAHNQRLANKPCQALAVAERALKKLNPDSAVDRFPPLATPREH